MTISRWTSNPAFKGYNCAKSGAKLTDGWGYRNFDYGFFQNAAYGNTAPDTLLISMGWNDVDGVNFESYLDNFDALIRKSWGYGCSVGLVTCNMNDSSRSGLEGAIKRTLASKYHRLNILTLERIYVNEAAQIFETSRTITLSQTVHLTTHIRSHSVRQIWVTQCFGRYVKTRLYLL